VLKIDLRDHYYRQFSPKFGKNWRFSKKKKKSDYFSVFIKYQFLNLKIDPGVFNSTAIAKVDVRLNGTIFMMVSSLFWH
jgi:hypothetical protein